MPTVKADISIRVDIEVKAESYAVADELIQQFLYVGSDDKRVVVTSGADIEVTSIECDEIEEQERLDLEVVLDKEASKHRKD